MSKPNSYDVYMIAKRVISESLCQISIGRTVEQGNNQASAILAKLAHADLLVVHVSELEELRKGRNNE